MGAELTPARAWGRPGLVMRGCRILGVVATVLACCSSGPVMAADQGSAPDAARVRQAAQSYDAGVRAWHEGRYSAAASHFEAADEAVPSAVSLAEAIKSRRKAGHDARAATLAARALDRHPDDVRLVELAREVIGELAPDFHRLEVRCSTDCVLAVGTRAIGGPATRSAVIYLEPGEQVVSASFAEDEAASARRVIVATAGGNNTLYFHPEGTAQPQESAVPAEAPPDEAPPARAPPSRDLAPPPMAPPTEPVGDGTKWAGLSPYWFIGGVGATAVVGGAAIWSGVDTMQSPGQDAVRESCVGLGTDCPAYQEGLDKQTRTNALIGVTAALGGLTAVVGLLLTDWSFGEAQAGSASGGMQLTAGPGTLSWSIRF